MSGDLRAAVLALDTWRSGNLPLNLVQRDRVLALIPEGAVLVTEADLPAALHRVYCAYSDHRSQTADEAHGVEAAAILRHLREGT